MQAVTVGASLGFCLSQLFLQQESQGLNMLGCIGYIIIEIWGGMARGTHPYPRHIRNKNKNCEGDAHSALRKEAA